jgi:1-acyl-sn-glycerol-3-phosphate acyltransferase
MGFMAESERILSQGGIVGIFPESRIPRPGEERPLPFAPSAAYLALSSGAPVIPVYTDGAYFSLRRRARVIIGTPFLAADLAGNGGTERERIARTAEAMRGLVKELGNELERQKTAALRG